MIFLCTLLFNPFKMTAYATDYSGPGPQGYTLNIKGPDGKTEQIKASEIDLKYDAYEEPKSTTGKIRFRRAAQYTYTDASGATIGISFDENLLREAIDKLPFFHYDNIIESKNAGFKYTEEGYVIIDEVYGNRVNKNALYRHLVNAICNMETTVDLKEIDCYDKPRYTSESQKTIEVKDMLNKYVSSKITYSFGEQKEILDGSIINQWITVDENFQVNLDEEKIKSFINGLNKYNAAGRAGSIVTSSGKVININVGYSSWVINTVKEVESLSAAIKEGQTITKEPIYGPRAYVEIDLSGQHLWFYKNGSLVIEGDIVSGDVRRGLKTPAGVYKLNYKRRYAILRGPGYTAPVDYWMPFNGGIGIHDAAWRRKFGGEIYKTDGSHGCINCPYNLAKKIYENIDVGTPVICYY